MRRCAGSTARPGSRRTISPSPWRSRPCAWTRDNARAAMLFREVARARDVRQAWLGLAIAQLNLADPAAAVEALGEALSRHVGAPDADLAAAAIVDAAGAPGWCSISGDGRVRIVLRQPVGSLAAMLDGRALRVGGHARGGVLQLPASWATAVGYGFAPTGAISSAARSTSRPSAGSRAASSATPGACQAGRGVPPTPTPIQPSGSTPSADHEGQSKSAPRIAASPCPRPPCWLDHAASICLPPAWRTSRPDRCA